MKKQVEAWVEEWKPVLRLQDWQIRIEIHGAEAMPEILGANRAIAQKRQAVIKLLDPDEYVSSGMVWPYDIEEVLVHELLHCYTHQIEDSQDIENTMMLEQMVDGLAWTLVAMKRAGADMTKVRALIDSGKKKPKKSD